MTPAGRWAPTPAPPLDDEIGQSVRSSTTTGITRSVAFS